MAELPPDLPINPAGGRMTTSDQVEPPAAATNHDTFRRP